MGFTAGTNATRRHAVGFSPITGFVNPARPNFDALAPYCAPDEHLCCDGWSAQGLGLALVPRLLIESERAYYLVTPERADERPVVTMFRAWLERAAAGLNG